MPPSPTLWHPPPPGLHRISPTPTPTHSVPPQPHAPQGTPPQTTPKCIEPEVPPSQPAQPAWFTPPPPPHSTPHPTTPTLRHASTTHNNVRCSVTSGTAVSVPPSESVPNARISRICTRGMGDRGAAHNSSGPLAPAPSLPLPLPRGLHCSTRPVAGPVAVRYGRPPPSGTPDATPHESMSFWSTEGLTPPPPLSTTQVRDPSACGGRGAWSCSVHPPALCLWSHPHTPPLPLGAPVRRGDVPTPAHRPP